MAVDAEQRERLHQLVQERDDSAGADDERSGCVQVRGLAAAVLMSACGGIPQAEECAKYLSCSEAVQPLSTRDTKATYGTGGTCWVNADDAVSCREVCKLATQALKMGAGRSTPECQ